MPCSDGRDYVSSNDVARLEDEVQKLKRLLCYACGELQFVNAAEAFANNPKLKVWWRAHHEEDLSRVKREMTTYMELAAPTTEQDVVDRFVKKAKAVHAVSRYHINHFFPVCYIWALSQLGKKR